MVRMNIMMTDELAVHLKSVPNKSRYVVMALEEKIQRERSKRLRAELAEAYMASSKENRVLTQEWSGVLKDGGWDK